KEYHMQIKRETILIYKVQTGWIARFEDPEILKMFGTFDIPTPFTETAEPAMVMKYLQKRNPSSIVRFLNNGEKALCE
ncbi:MAG: hypothetical protein ACHQYP_12640, partial [Nitrospiria bacterium]